MPLLLFFVSPSLQLITLQHSGGFIITYLLSDVARWCQWETEQALCKARVSFSLEVCQGAKHLWLFSLHFQSFAHAGAIYIDKQAGFIYLMDAILVQESSLTVI